MIYFGDKDIEMGHIPGSSVTVYKQKTEVKRPLLSRLRSHAVRELNLKR